MQRYGWLLASLVGCGSPTSPPPSVSLPVATNAAIVPTPPPTTRAQPQGTLRVWPMLLTGRKGLDLWVTNDQLYVSGVELFGRLTENGYAAIPAKGLGYLRTLTGVVGGYPNELRLTVGYAYSEAEAWGEVYGIGTDGALSLLEQMPKHRWHWGVVEWNGATVALTGGTTFDPVPAAFTVMRGSLATIPRPTNPLLLEHPIVTGDGALWALAKGEDDQLVAERWRQTASGMLHTVTPLGTPYHARDLVFGTDREGLVVLTAKRPDGDIVLHRVTTDACHRRPLSLRARPDDVAVCPDGTTWFAASERAYLTSGPGHLWRIARGRAPEDVTSQVLPERSLRSEVNGVTDVTCTSDGRLWIVANDVVLHSGSRPVTSPAEVVEPPPEP